MVGQKATGLLAAAAAVSASVFDLPVHIQNTYSSVELQVGTPPKPYRLMFDTGSSTTWMVNNNCNETSCPNGSGFERTQYDASASSTSVDLNSSATVGYIAGDGISGTATQDLFVDDEGTVEWNQTFLSVNKSSWRFITADGFLGLGFSSIAEQGTSSLVETLLWAGQLDAPRFGIYYGTHTADDGGDPDGVLTIGGSREDTYVNDDGVVYAPLRREDPYQLWRAPLRSVTVSATGTNATIIAPNDGRLPRNSHPNSDPTVGANVTLSLYGAGRAVFDTGAGRISLPTGVTESFFYNLGWNMTKLMNGEERMECHHMNDTWALSLTLGEGAVEDDVTVTIRGDEFYTADEQCQPPVDDSGTAGFALVGATFMRRFYSVYDFGADKVADYQPKIGFGRLKEEYDYFYQ